MDTPSLSPKPLSAWKRLAIISLFCGAGFALVAGLILGGIVWYTSRPTPPKPWNTTAIIEKEQPGFDVSDDGKMIEFRYTLENTGNGDYRIDSFNDIQILARLKDGTLSQPLPEADKYLKVPVFIPAKQKARIRLSLPFSGIPTRNTEETDPAFHERLRSYLEQQYGHVGGFVIFDGTNRYEIELSKWSTQVPK
jgi:hypothetical protein